LSLAVAEALRGWLPLVINAIDPWLSTADIEAGARWAVDVAGRLQQSKVGIICLTRSNLDSIWIHFEAGALAKTLDNTFVCPYLIDLEPSDIRGPLTQFQAMRANDTETLKLVNPINAALGDNGLKEEHVRDAFELAWPRLKAKLDTPLQEQQPKRTRNTEDMLEEVLTLLRGQARDAERTDRSSVIRAENAITVTPGEVDILAAIEGCGGVASLSMITDNLSTPKDKEPDRNRMRVRHLLMRMRDRGLIIRSDLPDESGAPRNGYRIGDGGLAVLETTRNRLFPPIPKIP
jgi:hypothetical protein